MTFLQTAQLMNILSVVVLLVLAVDFKHNTSRFLVSTRPLTVYLYILLGLGFLRIAVMGAIPI